MFLPRLQLKSFESLGWAWKVHVLRAFLDALVTTNRAFLFQQSEAGHPIKQMYEHGLIYIRDAPGVEDWKDIPQILDVGAADCKSLAAWRVAELRNAGESGAAPHVTFRKGGDGDGAFTMYHVAVQRENGFVEDPSRILGMS